MQSGSKQLSVRNKQKLLQTRPSEKKGSCKTNFRPGWYFCPSGFVTWIPGHVLYSCTAAVLYLQSFVVKSSASHTFMSTGSGPPLDSSPPGGSASFAGLHDNVALLYSLQTCQAATNKGPYSPSTITMAYVVARLV